MPTWRARVLSQAGVFSALVFAATLVSVSFPATGGYFNLGESMVYTSAVLGGPLVGAIAGGLGSALADVYLGYSQYAPGTLIIKGLEGFIVGLLYQRLSRASKDLLKRISLPAALAASLGLLVAGLYLYGILYGRAVELYLGTNIGVEFSIPMPVWVLLSAGVGVVIVYATTRWEPWMTAAILSMFAGGAVMITGYFLYEAIVLGYGITAAAEIPINIGQMLAGASIAATILAAVRSAEG